MFTVYIIETNYYSKQNGKLNWSMTAILFRCFLSVLGQMSCVRFKYKLRNVSRPSIYIMNMYVYVYIAVYLGRQHNYCDQ